MHFNEVVKLLPKGIRHYEVVNTSLFTYVYCNQVAIRVPLCQDAPILREQSDIDRAKTLDTLFHTNYTGFSRQSLFSVVEPHKKTCVACKGSRKQGICPECKGAGEIAFANRFNTYCVKCESCTGVGLVPPYRADEFEECEFCSGSGHQIGCSEIELSPYTSVGRGNIEPFLTLKEDDSPMIYWGNSKTHNKYVLLSWAQGSAVIVNNYPIVSQHHDCTSS